MENNNNNEEKKLPIIEESSENNADDNNNIIEEEEQNNTIDDEAVNNSVVDEDKNNLDDEQKITEEENAKRQLHKNFLKILIEFVLSSLVYLIANACSKFNDISGNAEIQNIVVMQYTKYVMLIAYACSIIGIILLIVYLCKVDVFKFKLNYNLIYNVFDWVVLLPICVALATFCFSFLFTITTVSGQSMLPNIHEDDKLLVTYPNQYERFDVVVIKVNDSYQDVDYTDLYLKRIIGLPGDTVDYVLVGDVTFLYINGENVEETFYEISELNDYPTFNKPNNSYETFNWSEKCFTGKNGTKEYCNSDGMMSVIPEGYYFVLGDNRMHSKDSRIFGLVKKEDIIGTANIIINKGFEKIA